MRLYQEVILLNNFFDGLYAVENVVPYYTPLIPAQKVDRHLWWANFKIGNYDSPKYEGDYLKASKSDLEKFYDFNVSANIYFDGSHDPAKCLKNGVHPETGLYILNCARNIITKSNINQLDIFEK
jgi:DNA (cytosine-5)-methyltransferase 1